MNHTMRTILLAVVTLMITFSLSAQQKEDRLSFMKIGVKGGIDFISLSKFEVGEISESVSSYTGFTAGVALSFDLPVQGLTIQPELLYVSKGARLHGPLETRVRMDYVEIPVNFQAGLDLILMRPYIMVSPYIGYAVYKEPSQISWDHFKRFEYGIGIGGGIDVWRIQLQVKYNWNIGGFMKSAEPSGGDLTFDAYESMIQSIEKSNLRGLEVNLVFFF